MATTDGSRVAVSFAVLDNLEARINKISGELTGLRESWKSFVTGDLAAGHADGAGEQGQFTNAEFNTLGVKIEQFLNALRAAVAQSRAALEAAVARGTSALV